METHRLLIAFLLVLVVLATIPGQVGYACSPAPNGFVFLDTIEADNSAFPGGMSFVHQSTYDLVFSNHGSETLFVLADPDLLDDTWRIVEPPSDLEDLLPSDRVIALEIPPGSATGIYRTNAGAFFHSFEPERYYDYDTPEQFAGLALPEPLETQVDLIAGGAFYEVPVTIAYAYNPEYDPEGFANAVEACAAINEAVERDVRAASAFAALPVIGIAVCGLLVALAGGAGLVIFLMRRRA